MYPGLTELDQVGESYYGQPLMLITITNEATGPAQDKPALYVDGGIHAGELTGSAVATHLIGHLLNGYGNDPRVTALLDTRAFYVRPKFNPDRLRPGAHRGPVPAQHAAPVRRGRGRRRRRGSARGPRR